MHVKEAKIHGERELRLHHLVIWRESPLFSDRECAALEWTEAVTDVARSGVPDALYERVKAKFSGQELTDLTLAINMINFWNRLCVSFRSVPGSADQMFGLDRAGLH
jgi:alkylhydroperoxidase family enzyme